MNRAKKQREEWEIKKILEKQEKAEKGKRAS